MIGRVHKNAAMTPGPAAGLPVQSRPGGRAVNPRRSAGGSIRATWSRRCGTAASGISAWQTGLMQIPVFRMGSRAPAEYVWHCSVRAAPGDPVLGDGAWMEIAAEIMDRTGLSRRGHEAEGVPWVAVHHGDQHIHIVAVLARQDGRRAALHNDYYRIGAALADLEDKLGLTLIARPDRTAARRPTRAETEKARRAGRSEPPRVTLCRLVAAAAAAARSEAEFWAGLEQRSVRVRLRHSIRQPGQVTGYAVALPGDLADGGEPVWFGGGQRPGDLTLPKLRCRWPGPGPSPGPGRVTGRERLSGDRMPAGAAKAALRHEVARVGAAARSEAEFWAGLEAAGLLVRQRPGAASGGSDRVLGEPARPCFTTAAVPAPHGQRVEAGTADDPAGDAGAVAGRAARCRPGRGNFRRGRRQRDLRVRGDRGRHRGPAAAGSTRAGSRRHRLGSGRPDRRGGRGNRQCRAAEGRRRVRAGLLLGMGPNPTALAQRGDAADPRPGCWPHAALAACQPGQPGWPWRRRWPGWRGRWRRRGDQQQRMLQAAAAREAAAGLAALHIPAWPGPGPAPAPGGAPAPEPAAAAWQQPGLFPVPEPAGPAGETLGPADPAACRRDLGPACLVHRPRAASPGRAGPVTTPARYIHEAPDVPAWKGVPMDPLDPSHAEPFGEANPGRFTQKIAEIASLSALAGQFARERRMRQAAKACEAEREGEADQAALEAIWSPALDPVLSGPTPRHPGSSAPGGRPCATATAQMPAGRAP